MRPLADDLVRLGEAARRREDRPRVADGDAVAEEDADAGDRGGEVGGAEHEHPRRRGEGLHEDGDVVDAALAVRAVVAGAGLALREHAARVVGDGDVEALGAERAGRRRRA